MAINTSHGPAPLPLQEALMEAAEEAYFSSNPNQGILGFMGVGSGKTLGLVAAAATLKAKRPVLIIPPRMKKATLETYTAFDVPAHLRPTIITYSDLSLKPGLLESLTPDVILLDEAHSLKNFSAARTRRFFRFLKEYRRSGKQLRLVAVSGTLSARSLGDYAHIADASLLSSTPFPFMKVDRDLLFSALSPDNRTGLIPAGLLGLLRGARTLQQGLDTWVSILKENPYLILDTSLEAALPALHIERLTTKTLPLSAEQIKLLEQLKTTWTSPEGIEISNAAHISAIARNISTGFYYSHPDYNADDKNTISEYARFVRLETFKSSGKTDTEKQIRERALRGVYGASVLTLTRRATSIKEGRKDPLWVNKQVLHLALETSKTTGTLIWVLSDALEDALLKAGLEPLPDGEPDPSKSYLCSIRRHGIGRNLQGFHRNLVLESPVSSSAWEQLIGRTHRTGQTHEVFFQVLSRTGPESDTLKKAKALSKYIAASTGKQQKLGKSRR